MFKHYDVIVAGAGHAGCEAAAAAANLGSKVLLITMNMQTIAQMSCNPAMGGIAKGQIIREIDAMGGYSGIVSDLSMIQFRMLNKSKGPAMWSPRSQNDRMQFAIKWREMLEKTRNVDFYQDMVTSIIIRKNTACGVVTGLGHSIFSKSVVITSGTFLNGIIHIGEKKFGGGRVSEKAATGITEQLVKLGFESERLKTGTPPRVDGRSINYAKMQEQEGDSKIVGFSFLETNKPKKQKSCWITYTNEHVHNILKTGFDRSPMYTGRIEGVGPRYCPSIEDKINRFAERDRHQLFIEPEGWDTVEVYVNGFSTSLPEEVQYDALRSVEGFETVKFFRPGYAIEYDYFPPTQLAHSLETKIINNLFFAGQINGTTGYEEAACQGLVAGINAHRKINCLEPVIFSRTNSYIGVLIDDLTTKETFEPYRMFTSRAEFRILLRQDNADLRLTSIGYAIGLASNERMNKVRRKESETNEIIRQFKNTKVAPEVIAQNETKLNTALLKEPISMYQLIKRPELRLSDICLLNDAVANLIDTCSVESLEQAEIQMKYETYIEREQELAEKTIRLEKYIVPKNIDYNSIKGLSSESKEKLSKIRPHTIGYASQISGVSPADVSILLVYLGR